MGDGSLVTWGDDARGGNSSWVQEQLRNVQHIQSNGDASAAALDNGYMVTWDHPDCGGDSSRVQEQLRNVQHIQANAEAVAALDNDPWSTGVLLNMVVTAAVSRSSSATCSTSKLPKVHLLLFWQWIR